MQVESNKNIEQAIHLGKKLAISGTSIKVIRETLESQFPSIETHNTTDNFAKSEMAKVMDTICEFRESL